MGKSREMASLIKIKKENPWESKEMAEDAGTFRQVGDEGQKEERGNSDELRC